MSQIINEVFTNYEYKIDPNETALFGSVDSNETATDLVQVVLAWSKVLTKILQLY